MKRRRLWLRTDEREDAVCSLEWALALARRVDGEPHVWKWTILALHNAAQGYMVLALTKGNGLLTLRPRIAKKWMEAYEGRGDFPTEKLDEFLELYAKVKQSAYFSSPFAASGAQDKSIARLNSLRNDFVHFTPKGWSIELSGLPGMVDHVTDLAEWATLHGDIAWYRPTHPTRTMRALRGLRRLTRRWREA